MGELLIVNRISKGSMKYNYAHDQTHEQKILHLNIVKTIHPEIIGFSCGQNCIQHYLRWTSRILTQKSLKYCLKTSLVFLSKTQVLLLPVRSFNVVKIL